MSSAVPQIKEALRGLALPTGVVWRNAEADEGEAEQVIVFRGKAVREWGPLGCRPQSLDEQVEITLLIEVVSRPRNTDKHTEQQRVEERAWEIQAALEQALRDDLRLGLDGTVKFVEAPRFIDAEQIGFRTDRREGSRIVTKLATRTRI